MQTHDSELPEQWAELKKATACNHGYLPVVAAYCRRPGLVEIVNHLVQSQMQIQPGLVVQANNWVVDWVCCKSVRVALKVCFFRSEGCYS